MDVGRAAELLAILIAPTAVAGAVLWLPRVVRVLHRRLSRPADRLRPAGPPLERTAAVLRRLVAEHEAVRRSPLVAVRANHLTALEGAITDCALDAARAVELEVPPRTSRAPLPREQLRLLLQDLADAGLVLPAPERFGR